MIGKGFYSKVFLASKDHDDLNISIDSQRSIKDPYNKYVAIKSISKRKIIQKNSIDYILTEKNILSNVDNENIIKLFSTTQNERKIFFILEYFKNGDLFNYLSQFKFFEEDIVKFIMLQIFHLLQYLHFKKIVYRDLKPENIMISDDGFVKLIDFGLARQLKDENEKLTDICGTNEYIPPEVINRENYSYNFDWWGFGILMFELLIGKVSLLFIIHKNY